MMNVLLFGIGPLVLAGLIVAAFVLVAPAKGSASSLGFKAGPAPSTQQLVATPSRSPSALPSAHKKKHPRAASTAKTQPRPGKSAKATPKPERKAGKVTPHNLGLPNFAGYCQHIGHRTAEVVASNAYGWRCTLTPGLVIKTVNVCAWTYHLSTSQVVDVSTNYYDPNAWQCWRINRDLTPGNAGFDPARLPLVRRGCRVHAALTRCRVASVDLGRPPRARFLVLLGFWMLP